MSQKLYLQHTWFNCLVTANNLPYSCIYSTLHSIHFGLDRHTLRFRVFLLTKYHPSRFPYIQLARGPNRYFFSKHSTLHSNFFIYQIFCCRPIHIITLMDSMNSLPSIDKLYLFSQALKKHMGQQNMRINKAVQFIESQLDNNNSFWLYASNILASSHSHPLYLQFLLKMAICGFHIPTHIV